MNTLIKEEEDKKEPKEFADSIINEKKIGILAWESRFLVKCITSFQSLVIKIFFSYF